MGIEVRRICDSCGEKSWENDLPIFFMGGENKVLIPVKFRCKKCVQKEDSLKKDANRISLHERLAQLELRKRGVDINLKE